MKTQPILFLVLLIAASLGHAETIKDSECTVSISGHHDHNTLTTLRGKHYRPKASGDARFSLEGKCEGQDVLVIDAWGRQGWQMIAKKCEVTLTAPNGEVFPGESNPWLGVQASVSRALSDLPDCEIEKSQEATQ